MAVSVRLGQYVPTHSVLHSLNAATKLVCALVSAIVFFLISRPIQLLLGAAYTLMVVALSRVGIVRVLKSMRTVLLLFLILFFFNLLFVQTGDTLVKFWIIRITADGVWAALQYSSRLLMALLVGSMILYTTTPTDLSDSLDKLFSPLQHLGLPAHEIAMVFALMLRFVPVISEETNAIIEAQALRGGSFTEGSFRTRTDALMSVLTALFAAGIRHANNLARALEAKSYVAGAPRSHLHESYLHISDAGAAMVTALFVVAIIICR